MVSFVSYKVASASVTRNLCHLNFTVEQDYVKSITVYKLASTDGGIH